MKRMFLCSLFKGVSELFVSFIDEDLKNKRITFIPTAGTPDKLEFHMNHCKKLLSKMGLIIDELEISTATDFEIETKLQKNDYIYVGGGNTFFLLQELKRTGAGEIIKSQISLGKPFIGESAGAMVLAPNIAYGEYMDKPEVALQLKNYDGLNILGFYPLPHYKNFPTIKTVDKIIKEYSPIIHLVPIRNSQAILIYGVDVQIVQSK